MMYMRKLVSWSGLFNDRKNKTTPVYLPVSTIEEPAGNISYKPRRHRKLHQSRTCVSILVCSLIWILVIVWFYLSSQLALYINAFSNPPKPLLDLGKQYTPLPLPSTGNNTDWTKEGFPKIIHQTAKDKNLPEHWRITSELVRRLNPDWRYILWTDEMNRQLIKEHYSYFLWAFDGYPYGISRADAIRYHILHRYGGVYIDLDIVPKSPLSEMRFVFDANPEDIDVVFPKTPNFVSDQVTNSFMVSKPGAAFMHLLSLELMNNVIPPYFMIPHSYVVDSTGPHFCSRIVHRTNAECLVEQGRDLLDPRICRISLFPPEVFGLCSVCAEDLTQAKMLEDPELYSSKFRSQMEKRWPDLQLPPPKCPVGPNTMFQHFNAKSWNKLDSVTINYIFCNLSRLKSFGIFLAFVVGSCCLIRIINRKRLRVTVTQDENTIRTYLSDNSDFSL